MTIRTKCKIFHFRTIVLSLVPFAVLLYFVPVWNPVQYEFFLGVVGSIQAGFSIGLHRGMTKEFKSRLGFYP